MRDILVKVVNESYEHELAAIRCPTAFVWGRHDTAGATRGRPTCPRDGGWVDTGGARLRHDVHLEHPELFVELIDRLGDRSELT